MSEEADAEESTEETSEDEGQDDNEDYQDSDSGYSENDEHDQDEEQESDLEKEVEDETESEEQEEEQDDNLEEKIIELKEKGIDDERLFAKLREGDYSIFDELPDLMAHFILSVLNIGYVSKNNEEILKKDYAGKKINVLVLGTLEGEDNGAEYVKACKKAGKDCYVITINYSKPLEEIAEEVAEEIIAVIEETNAESVIADAFSLGGAGLFLATQMKIKGLDQYVCEATYYNTPLSSERTGSTKIIQFLGSVKTKENARAIRKAVNLGYTQVPSTFVFSMGDSIVPYNSNVAIARTLGAKVVSIENARHTTIMDSPDALVGTLYKAA